MAISSEMKFRKIIYEYLNKQDNIDCHLIHGTNEHGIDILVRERDVFNEYRFLGISVKIGDIKCSRGKNPSLSTIIHQIIIASNHKFPPYDQYLDYIYLVTDGNISQEARTQILSVKIPYRTIYFLEKTHINKLLRVTTMQKAIFGGETVK